MSLDLYVALRHAHIGLALLSVTLFSLRGLAVLWGAHWPLAARTRALSICIDVLLLAAGLSLVVGLQVSQPWLAVKLAWLVAYIVAGSFALKRARTRRGKALALGWAAFSVTMLVGVARAHHPLGWFS